jgi:integrase
MGSLYRRTPKGKYYGEFTTADGRRIRKSTGTSVKQDAARILAKWEADANESRHGFLPGVAKSLGELLEEYLNYIGNTGQGHRDKTEARIQRLIAANGWKKVAEINQYQVETTVRSLRDVKTEQKLSLRTQGHYLTSIKSFTAWLTNVRNALHRDPLRGVRKPNFAADRKRIRRFLLPDEWPWLAQTAHSVLYQTAIETGFRANELRNICREHVRSDHIYLPAPATKNRLPAKQYITAGLRAKLEQVDLPFVVPDDDRLAELLRTDLAIARDLHLDLGPSNKPIGFLQPVDALGHVLDFHALRHTCGAWLAISNVNPKVIQTVMRHSTITLTLDTYGHLMPGAEQDAVQHFARIMAVDLCQESDQRGLHADT